MHIPPFLHIYNSFMILTVARQKSLLIYNLTKINTNWENGIASDCSTRVISNSNMTFLGKGI